MRIKDDAALAVPTDAYAASVRRRKALPEHARALNRTLTLQTLLDEGPQSRADLSRSTSLTRVTISELVADLIAEGLVHELGRSDQSRPGKPATLIDIRREEFQIVGIDLSDSGVFRGALLDLDGTVIDRAHSDAEGLEGDAAVAGVVDLAKQLLQRATGTVLGVGVGTPGVVDIDGFVRLAPNLAWHALPLRALLADALDVPVHVANDGNAALLAERASRKDGDLLVVRIGLGVGSGLSVAGVPVRGSGSAAGEIGHVTVGTDDGPSCACGRRGCLEAWVAVPRLRAQLAAAGPGDRERILAEAGRRLGIVLAPIVGALNLPLVVMSGPEDLIVGTLMEATKRTLDARTLEQFNADVTYSLHGDDIVMRGAATLVRTAQLGVS